MHDQYYQDNAFYNTSSFVTNQRRKRREGGQFFFWWRCDNRQSKAQYVMMQPFGTSQSCIKPFQSVSHYRLLIKLMLPSKLRGTHWDKTQLFIRKIHINWCLKNETLKMWILWKMRFWKCEFIQKWDFQNVNFVKNEIFKMWILWKMRFSKYEFLDKLRIFAPVCDKKF